MIIIDLPTPPSLNNAYINVRGRGRVPSKAYAQWKINAGWELKTSKPDKINGPYRLDIRVCVNLRGDIDNRVKAISDLLVEHEITPDDSRAQSITIRRSPGQRGRCIVRVEAA